MAIAFTRKYCEDRADGRLQFIFCCDICQKGYAAPAIEAPEEPGLFHGLKLKRTYQAAFDEAQENAKEHFSLCPVCNRWVCDACIRILPEGDLCKECAPIALPPRT